LADVGELDGIGNVWPKSSTVEWNFISNNQAIKPPAGVEHLPVRRAIPRTLPDTRAPDDPKEQLVYN